MTGDAPHQGAATPYAFARRVGATLIWRDGQPVCLHRRDVAPESLLETLRIAGGAVAFEAMEPAAFDAALAALRRDGAEAAAQAADSDGDLAALAESVAERDDLLDDREDAPVVRLVNALLLQAVREGASDVHVEPREHRVAVRFRVDGRLREIVSPRRALAPLLASRIKVMARLDIAERRLPQDGRVALRVAGREIDLRVSTLPSQHGERVVMRLLDRTAVRLDLDALGMGAGQRATLERALGRPSGLILVTGPTGSGKTTTLYAALSRLNESHRNIMTIEDPVEYALEGVGQTQVDARAGLSFARGLRAILRQDPDVVMVGEIRDAETAQVAVQAAMTGHLVLSTLHTNSAVGAVSRLLDMGVQRWLLAPTLACVVAQRLVRALCPACRAESVATEADSALLGGALAPGARVWRPVGCPACRGEGFIGRIGLHEAVGVEAAFAALVHDGASEADLTAAARAAGPGLLEAGLDAVAWGRTTPGELALGVAEG